MRIHQANAQHIMKVLAQAAGHEMESQRESRDPSVDQKICPFKDGIVYGQIIAAVEDPEFGQFLDSFEKFLDKPVDLLPPEEHQKGPLKTIFAQTEHLLKDVPPEERNNIIQTAYENFSGFLQLAVQRFSGLPAETAQPKVEKLLEAIKPPRDEAAFH